MYACVRTYQWHVPKCIIHRTIGQHRVRNTETPLKKQQKQLQRLQEQIEKRLTRRQSHTTISEHNLRELQLADKLNIKVKHIQEKQLQSLQQL